MDETSTVIVYLFLVVLVIIFFAYLCRHDLWHK